MATQDGMHDVYQSSSSALRAPHSRLLYCQGRGFSIHWSRSVPAPISYYVMDLAPAGAIFHTGAVIGGQEGETGVRVVPPPRLDPAISAAIRRWRNICYFFAYPNCQTVDCLDD